MVASYHLLRKGLTERPSITLAIVGLLALAIALRFIAIANQSLWYDEGVSAGMVGQSVWTVVRWSAADFQPPLYYLVLDGWAKIFGSSETSLRGLSAIAGVIVVGVTFMIARGLLNAPAAWLSGLWLATAPLAIIFSQEVRMYMPVAAAVSVAALLALRWIEEAECTQDIQGRSRGFLVGYIFAAVIGLYFQYVAALGLAAIGLTGLLRLRRNALRTWIIANCVALALFAPWLPVLHYQLASGRTATTTGAGAFAVLRASLGSLLLGVDGLPAFTILAAFALGTLTLLGTIRMLARGRDGWLPLLLVIIPIVVVVIYAAWKHVFEVRYILVGLPGITLILGGGIELLLAAAAHLRSIFMRRSITTAVLTLAAIALLGSGFAADIRYYVDPLHPNDNYRGLVATIVRNAEPGDAIVLYAPGQNHVFDYYYRGPDRVIGVPLDRPPNQALEFTRLDELAKTHKRIWLVEYGQTEADPHGIILQWFARHAYLASHQWFGSVQLELFRIDSGHGYTVPLDAHFAGGITLKNVQLSSTLLHPGETLGLTLVWTTKQHIPISYTVFTHLLNKKNQVVAQHDGIPAGGTRPTNRWLPGQVIQDLHGIVLPKNTAPGTYQIEVGLYQVSSGERDPVVNTQGRVIGNRVLVVTVRVGED